MYALVGDVLVVQEKKNIQWLAVLWAEMMREVRGEWPDWFKLT